MSSEFDPFSNADVQMQAIEPFRVRKDANDPILCEVITDFYGACGHYVYRMYCNNPNRRVIDDMLQDPTTCCDATCAPRNQKYVVVHGNDICIWCDNSPIEPDTIWNRSDAEEGAYPFLDLEAVNVRRTENYLPPLSVLRTVQLERRKSAYNHALRIRQVLQAQSEAIDDYLNLSALERLYFTGFGCDDTALYAPVTEENFGALLGGKSCVVCADGVEFVPSQKNAVLLPCRHGFHKNCLKPWFEGTHTGVKRTTCPTCRHAYRVDIGEDDIEDYTGV